MEREKGERGSEGRETSEEFFAPFRKKKVTNHRGTQSLLWFNRTEEKGVTCGVC